MNDSEQNNQPPLISIVIPMHNEAGNVSTLVEQVCSHVEMPSLSFELVLVDDGSTDSTWQCIETEALQNDKIQGLKLSRNFGHQHALLAGLAHSRGDAVISMDADLQHPPEILPEMISRWQRGEKIVYTRRHDGNILAPFKRYTSSLFYRFFSWITDVPLDDGGSDFRLVDRKILEEVAQFNDASPFLRGSVRWLGYDSVSSTVDYDLGQRHSGQSTYSVKKMVALANSAILSFSSKPLILAIWVGLFTSLLAFAELIYIIIQYVNGVTVPGWASTVGIISLLFGILFVLLGIVGMYLAQIHSMLQNRPKYIIERQVKGSGRDID